MCERFYPGSWYCVKPCPPRYVRGLPPLNRSEGGSRVIGLSRITLLADTVSSEDKEVDTKHLVREELRVVLEKASTVCQHAVREGA